MTKIILALLTLLLVGCGAPEDTTGDSNTTVSQNILDENNVTIRFLDYNDFHAHLTPHKEEVLQADGTILLSMRGGIARLATKIDSLKTDNTIVMNIGDTYHGGAEALFSSGNDIVDIINAIGFDVGVPGNWDYSYGPVVSNARYANMRHEDVKRPNFVHLGANMKYKDPALATTSFTQSIARSLFSYQPGEDFLAPTLMLERSGRKIGMIGISSDIIERMYEIFAMNIEVLQGEQNYKNLINTLAKELRDNGADMVVVMSELGIQKDKKLADIIDENSVDMFFSAHTHEATFTMIDSLSGAKVVEAGDDTYLGELNVDFEGKKLVAMRWKLHSITQDIQAKESIKNMVSAIRAPYLVANPNIEALVVKPDGIFASLIPIPSMPTLTHSLDEIITRTPISLSRKHVLESSYNNAFTDMLRTYTGADVAMTPGFRYTNTLFNQSDAIWQLEDNTIINDAVKIEDVYRFLPVGSGIAVAKTSVANLKNIIELNLKNVFSTDAFNQNGGWFDGFSGIELNLSLKNSDGERINSISFDTPRSDDDIINVAGCSRPGDEDAGKLCSYPGFTEVTPLINPSNSEAFFGVDFLIYAFSNGFLQSVSKRDNIHDDSNTSFWPQTPYVQPIEGAK